MTPRTAPLQRLIGISCLLVLAFTGCKKPEPDKEAREAPPASPPVVQGGSSGQIHVEGADRFQLANAVVMQTTSKLDVTGSVSPDVSRELPVLSLANGRVVALHVGLGDTVHKGQLVMEVQSPDVTTAFDGYLKAVNDEHLTKVTLDRDKLLYDKGAIPQSQLQAAQNGEDDAKADLTAAEQQLHILGVDKNHPGETVKVYAPATGVVISQNVTAAGAAGITYAGTAGSLTIADLSHVWVICDVYENDLATRPPRPARRHPPQRLPRQGLLRHHLATSARSSTPASAPPRFASRSRTRGDLLRIGMFATATFDRRRTPDQRSPCPPTAVLHLHDRAYVFEPAGNGRRLPPRPGQDRPHA